MRKRKRLFGVLLVIAALIIMQLPAAEADAATSSASDFKMEGSTLVKYRGTEKNVSVPNTVEVIGEGAFEDNTNIELVVLPNSVKRIEGYAFWGCDNLDTVVLGKGLTEVGDYAFAGCKGLVQMTIPSNVTSIGVQAFGDCVNLKDIAIPPETKSIHETAFAGCYQLTIHCDEGTAADTFAKAFYERQGENPEYEDVPGYDDYVSGEDEKNPEDTEPTPVPEPVFTPEPDTSAGDLIGSTRIVGNKAVVFIRPGSLNVYDGTSQPSAAVSAQQPAADFNAGPIEGGIPKFAIVDGSVVADQAFYRNEGLQALTLPEGIREIGQFAYARSSLAEGILPSGVETVSYGAFYHCDNLVTVVLPDTVQNVEPKAFEHTAWVDAFLDGASADQGDFLISGGVLAAYRGNGREVVIPDGVRVIAAEAFLGHTEIAAVTLPGSLQVIGEGAFEGCTKLREVQWNEGLLRIKDRAFYRCALQPTSLPASVVSVGLRALEGVEVTYAGDVPEDTYEVSAARLSNEAYRDAEPDAEAVAPGVAVEEPDGATASLAGAQRSYVLRIVQSGRNSAMERAFARAFGTSFPAGTVNYEMTLTDNSGIPLTKLGRQTLTVSLPLPESLAGQELRLFGLDRNGQLVELNKEWVTVEGVESLWFTTNEVSSLAVCPTGRQESGAPIEITMERESLGAPPQAPSAGTAFPVKLLIGAAFLMTGIILILAGGRKRTAKRPI